MSREFGVLIEAITTTPGAPDAAVELAVAAEANGLDLVVVSAGAASDDTAGLDPWTVAVWLAARTERIAIGVVEPAPAGRTRGAALGIAGGAPDAERPVPSVVARARESAAVLAGARIVAGGLDGATSDPDWRTAPRDADFDALATLADDGVPVVAPVSSVGDVERVAALAREVQAAAPSRPQRSAAVRSHRVPGIAYDEVPDSLAEDAVEPGDRAHRSVSSTYLRGGAPASCCAHPPSTRSSTRSPSPAATATCRSASAAAATASADDRRTAAVS